MSRGEHPPLCQATSQGRSSPCSLWGVGVLEAPPAGQRDPASTLLTPGNGARALGEQAPRPGSSSFEKAQPGPGSHAEAPPKSGGEKPPGLWPWVADLLPQPGQGEVEQGLGGLAMLSSVLRSPLATARGPNVLCTCCPRLVPSAGGNQTVYLICHLSPLPNLPHLQPLWIKSPPALHCFPGPFSCPFPIEGNGNTLKS